MTKNHFGIIKLSKVKVFVCLFIQFQNFAEFYVNVYYKLKENNRVFSLSEAYLTMVAFASKHFQGLVFYKIH